MAQVGLGQEGGREAEKEARGEKTQEARQKREAHQGRGDQEAETG
jgi:hypothetical protein